MASDRKPPEGHQLALVRKSRGMSMVPGLGGTKQWEFALKKFAQTQKVTCKSVPQELPRLPYPKKTFPTGSSYDGSWNELGMSGIGVYEFPPDNLGRVNKYKGEFNEGHFHGNGEIIYHDGATLKGKWDKGQVEERTLIFADGLEYSEDDWNYLFHRDRRYTAEYDGGLRPAGDSLITPTPVPREIPPGSFDTIDGIFDPTTRKVTTYEDANRIIRAVSDKEKQWIVENCRTAPDESLGPCPFLYEEWRQPTLTVEDCPPPSVRTKTYIEEMKAITSWKLELSEKKRPSYNPLSKFGRFSFHRSTTASQNGEWSARQSRSSTRSSHGSQAGDLASRKLMFESTIRIQSRSKMFSERTRSIFRDRSMQDKLERQRSLQKKVESQNTEERKKSLKSYGVKEEPLTEPTPRVFKRDDDVVNEMFITPQRNPNW